MRLMKIIILSALTASLATTCVEQAGGETLGDVLREHGWDGAVGTWVDEETGGENLKVTYEWRFEETLVEITTWTANEESVAFMGLNSSNGDVFHVGATSRGGSSLGRWDAEGDDVLLSLRFTTGEGERGTMKVRQRLEDENTMVVTIEGPEPSTFRMVRADVKELKNPRMGKRDAIEQRIRAAVQAGRLTQGEGEKKLEAIRRKLRAASPTPKEDAFVEGATLVHVKTLIRNFDTDGNLTIEEDELEEAFLERLDRYDRSLDVLLRSFDQDRDGALDDTESRSAREFVFALGGMLLYDSNGDWKLSEAEADRAWDRLADVYQNHNETVLRKFDSNRDGKLSEKETQIGKRQVRRKP